MINRLPVWFRQVIPNDKTLSMTRLLSEFGVRTVCQEAHCPNINNCFTKGRLTFIILGNACTRSCFFCAVGTVLNSRQNCPHLRLTQESSLISQVVKILGLNYVVITSVCRDDLADGGASQFAKTLELIHKVRADIKVEVLIPDFCGKILALKCVLAARPTVVAHNIETVNGLYAQLRPQADYQLSLSILSKVKELRPDTYTKSSIMLGLGETKQQVISTLEDLIKHKCDILTLGQYLAPSSNHYPVKDFISIEQFQEYQSIALGLGFKAVLSGPLVRSSYQAEEVYREILAKSSNADSRKLHADTHRYQYLSA